MSFAGKNGKSSLKYQKNLESFEVLLSFAIYGTRHLTSGYPLGSVFWYPLGHNPTTGYPAMVLFYTPYSLSCAPSHNYIFKIRRRRIILLMPPTKSCEIFGEIFMRFEHRDLWRDFGRILAINRDLGRVF